MFLKRFFRYFKSKANCNFHYLNKERLISSNLKMLRCASYRTQKKFLPFEKIFSIKRDILPGLEIGNPALNQAIWDTLHQEL